VHPFLDREGPIAFAHRGGADCAPENTLPAFNAAIGLGYLFVETDVHATRDQVVVAFHDARLDRVTNLGGAIAELDIDEVESADAGYRFSRDAGRTHPFRGRGIQVPRLEHLLERWPQVRLNVDPKSDAAVEPLAALLDRTGAWERVCIGSFSDRRLRRVRALGGPRACTSMGPRAATLARAVAAVGHVPRRNADCIQIPLRHGRIPLVTPRFLRAAHRTGLPVHVWTIDDAATMHTLLELGVDGIMTNRPALLRDVFAARGLSLAGRAPGQRRVTPAGP
jgi:glycerophosphoryl diester phosphodiesterase